jgi:superfamily II DNA or RNA helicase
MATLPSFRPGDIVRIRGDRWIVARHVIHGDCAILQAHRGSAANAEHASFILPAEPIERLASSGRPRVVRPTRWRGAVRAALGRAAPSPTSLLTAAGATFDLLPFQLEPALAVTSGAACRLLIADEVGLGKTVQAALVISEILERVPDGRALVATPAGLRQQWEREMARLLGLRATVIDAAALAAMSGSAQNPWAAHRLVIASIDFIKRPEVLRSVEALLWDVLVLDEAHALAGLSDRREAASALAARARIVVLLTATPHGGDDAAFERLCGIGDLAGRFPCLLFRRTRADAGLPSARRTSWLRIAPTLAERRMHTALAEYTRAVWRVSTTAAPRLAMTVLARRAASSALSLARSLERRLALLSEDREPEPQLTLPIFDAPIDDEPDVVLGAQGLPDLRSERAWLARLLTLATNAAATESKVRALRRLLRRSRVPALVFTEYRDTLERVSAQLGGDVVHLHGGMTPSEREEAAERFTSGHAIVMLATDAASEGLNLQRRCHLVVNLELPWSPVRLEQRIGRVDRIGQSARVHAVHLLASGTIEDHIVARLLHRADRARAALDIVRPLGDLEIARYAFGSDVPLAAEPAAGAPPDTAAGTHRATDHVRPVAATAPPPYLRAAAIAEAVRLSTARALLRAGHRHPSFDRPLLVNLSRKRSSPRCCWAFRVRVTDAVDAEIWETLLGVQATGICVHPSTPTQLRSALAVHLRIREESMRAATEIAASVRHSLAPAIALADARERAIRDAIARQRARMAAALAQRSLFDHRPDRVATAQEQVAAAVLRRCAMRLRHIDAMRSLSTRHELLFAVSLD